MANFIWLMLAMFTVLGSPGAAFAQAQRQKVALVIGNGNYDGVGGIDVSPAAVDAAKAAGLIPDLANPVRDAALIRDALTAAGFTVRYVENADYAILNSAIATFMEDTRHLGRESLTVFYFAGHGVTVDGRPYLIPVGARAPALPVGEATEFSRLQLVSPPGAELRAQILQSVATPLTSALGAKPPSPDAPGRLIILDNCRDNPWFRTAVFDYLNESGSASLTTQELQAELQERSEEAEDAARRLKARQKGAPVPLTSAPRRNPYVIAYAAAANAKALDGDGANSPFAIALSTNIQRQNITIGQMLGDTAKQVSRATRRKQTPSYYPSTGSPVYEYCLVACAPAR